MKNQLKNYFMSTVILVLFLYLGYLSLQTHREGYTNTNNNITKSIKELEDAQSFILNKKLATSTPNIEKAINNLNTLNSNVQSTIDDITAAINFMHKHDYTTTPNLTGVLNTLNSI